jgi:hypothetical protein
MNTKTIYGSFCSMLMDVIVQLPIHQSLHVIAPKLNF